MTHEKTLGDVLGSAVVPPPPLVRSVVSRHIGHIAVSMLLCGLFFSRRIDLLWRFENWRNTCTHAGCVAVARGGRIYRRQVALKGVLELLEPESFRRGAVL